MNARRVLLSLVPAVILLALVVGPASAAPPAWASQYTITCDDVWGRLQNNGQSGHAYTWYIKNMTTNTILASSPGYPAVVTGLAPNAWVETSHYDPPAGFVGTIRVHIQIYYWYYRWIVADEIYPSRSLNCAPQHIQVTLCHATPPDTAAQGYNQITIDDDGVFQQGHSGQHSADIIPPFTYYGGSFPGQNWDAEGQNIWNHGCQAVYTTEVVEVENDCDDWQVDKIFYLNGVEYDRQSASGTWSDPFVLETASAFGQTVNEPSNCQETHQVTWDYVDDCIGWSAFYAIDGGTPVAYASGSWTQPFVLEDADVPAFDIPTNPGELYSVTQVPGQHIDEDRQCQQVHQVTYGNDADCDEAFAYYQIDGALPVTYFTYDWTDPFVLEDVDAPAFDIPTNPGEVYDLTTIPAQHIDEDRQCQQVHQVTYDESIDCNGVSAYYQIDGGAPVTYFTHGWSDQYVLEDTDAPAFDIPTNPGEVYDLTTIPAQHFDEPQQCLITLRHSYTVTPSDDCTGWSYTLTVPEPTTSITLASGAESGLWSDTYTLENNSGQVPTWHVVWDDGFAQDVSGSTIYEDRTCLPPGDFSISTESYCEGNDAMVYDTIVLSPYNTTAELSVLWFYPNGNAFVTGETSLGTVALTTGTNIFSSSLTKAELIAAIGDNNLTGGNPANDVNYDRLDLYTYEVILRVDGVEDALVSNQEDLWGNCDVPQREIPRCPECGPPVWEQSFDGMALVWFSTTPCVIDWENWCISITETTRAWSQFMFYVEIRGELLPAEQAVGADGNTWYVLEFDPGDGNFILWGANGQGDRFRNYGPVYKYAACSVAPGWQDTTAEGFLIVRNGMNRSDIIQFLIREDDAFFVGEEHRGSLAIEWVNSHLPEGPLVTGTLMELPAISQ